MYVERCIKWWYLCFISTWFCSTTARPTASFLGVDDECVNQDRQSGPSYWIGGQRLNPMYESTVVWKSLSRSSVGDYSSEITKEVMYSKWRRNEPDYKRGSDQSPEACVSLNIGADGEWSDEQCTHKFCFVCELDLPSMSTTWLDCYA